MSKLKNLEIMNRASFLRHNTKTILKLDLSNLHGIEEVKRVTEFFRSVVERMRPKSLVGLVDFTGLTVNEELYQEMLTLMEICNPYFKATAVIANSPETISVVEAMINHFGEINLTIFHDDESAENWFLAKNG